MLQRVSGSNHPRTIKIERTEGVAWRRTGVDAGPGLLRRAAWQQLTCRYRTGALDTPLSITDGRLSTGRLEQ